MFRVFPAMMFVMMTIVTSGQCVLGEEQDSAMNERFERLAQSCIDESPSLSPTGATSLGDHRFDRKLDEISSTARERQRDFCTRYLAELRGIDRAKLSREHQVDYQLLNHSLRSELWSLETLQEWNWNPILYTQLTGGAIYGLMAREFAPVEERLASVTARLEEYPQLFDQIRNTLDKKRVPPIHAETAIKQNRGVLNIIDNMVRPHLGKLGEAKRARLLKAISVTTDEV